MDDYHGFSSDVNGNGSFDACIQIHKVFRIVPKRDHVTKEWVSGICYKDHWGNVYHPETATAGLLKGTLTLND